MEVDQKEKRDALRFAALLSKSNDSENGNAHKIWAQEIVILLDELYPEEPLIKLYAFRCVKILCGSFRG